MNAKITVLAGDGVGPEVVNEACKVLETVANRFDHRIEFTDAMIGGGAIDKLGTPLPEETIEICKDSDAVLLGAVGGPKWDDPLASVRPEQGLLGLRKALGVFANLRPVRVYPQLAKSGPLKEELVANVDMLVIRELTGGIYFGDRGKKPDATGEFAFDTMGYSTGEVERIVRLAANKAKGRRNKLTSVDKANVLEVSRLWRSTAERVMRDEFADVGFEHGLVDAAAMHLIQRPADFDVIVTGNLFGDILTDEASVLAGSMGLLPSASLGDSGPGLYEPIHGSAPDIAGKGIANPIGMILSAAMLCRESLGWHKEAESIEAAVEQVVAEGVRTPDMALAGETTVGTIEMGRKIVLAIRELATSASAA
ncbi:MAG: 3-isopropylmalate dehydrogenase [Planctomycetes bacterium]|nr:3-isopropylmalate dehydrogenase [Planctomycetota bacterium]